jgi:RNA polymerase sporulation-specific sigma factor
LGREPTVEEISSQVGLPREEVVMAMEAIIEPVSLYDPVYSDESDSLYIMDQVRDDTDNDNNWIEEISLRQAINQLTEREKHILSLRFFAGKTQVEVASEVGISQAQVSRLEKSALTQIKKHL